MEYTHLGRSGLEVSRFCLGTMNFGPQTTAEDAFTILDAALDQGVNFVDTANDYGGSAGKGRTEEIIGDWFQQGGGRRERTVLATKAYAPMGDWPNDGKLSALNLRNSLDASLRRLKTDYVDVLQFHHIDRATPWDEIWQAIDVAIQQGKILYVGSSNFAGWHISAAQEAAARRQMLGLVSEQSFYNLLIRDIEREVIPAVEHYGLALLPWSPLNQGFLAGVLKAEREGSRRLTGRSAAALEAHRDKIERYEKLAAEAGMHPAQTAIAWLLHQPAVTAPIIGPRTRQQLDSALAAVTMDLDGRMLRLLDEIFPGYQPAPEDYAW